MIFRFRNRTMNCDLVNTLAGIQGQYNDLLSGYQAQVRDTNKNAIRMHGEPEMYTDGFIDDFVSRRTAATLGPFQVAAQALNHKAVETVSNFAQAVKNALLKVDRADDHATKVSNALAFLSLTGAELNDERAHAILKDFEDDPETMHLFAPVIEKQTGVELLDSYGRSTWPKTFGYTNKVDRYLKEVDELSGFVADLYTLPMKSSELQIAGGRQYHVPMDGLTQLLLANAIPGKAQTIQEMTGELFPVVEA